MQTHDPPMPSPPRVREVFVRRPPVFVHGAWRDAFPWLAQGTTARGASSTPFDLGLGDEGSPRSLAEGHWDEVLRWTGMRRAVQAPQVHGRVVSRHGNGPPGLHVVEECDAHVTDRPGVLLAVTTADCVPVFVVDPRRRAIGMVHAGWRGTAAGVLEATVAVLTDEMGCAAHDLHVHLGPAICGRCYEVGPEVFAALGQPSPAAATPIDLRRLLADRVRALGVPVGQTSVSAHCTRCTGSGLFSHRAGDRERQIGYLAIRAEPAVVAP